MIYLNCLLRCYFSDCLRGVALDLWLYGSVAERCPTIAVEDRANGADKVLGTWPNAHVASVGIGILQSCLGISQLVTLPGNFVLFFLIAEFT